MRYQPELTVEQLLDRVPDPTLVWFYRFWNEVKARLRTPRRRPVLEFLAYQHEHGNELSDISLPFLDGYLAYLHKNCRCAGTRAQRQLMLRRWLRFLFGRGLLLSPWHLDVPGQAHGHSDCRLPLSEERVQQLLLPSLHRSRRCCAPG